jgi:hypothetical protein
MSKFTMNLDAAHLVKELERVFHVQLLEEDAVVEFHALVVIGALLTANIQIAADQGALTQISNQVTPSTLSQHRKGTPHSQEMSKILGPLKTL